MKRSVSPTRVRFSAWLQQKVNAGAYTGLVWLDREQGLFRVPWFHFSRSEDVSAHFQLFRDWAVHTGTHSARDPENYPRWKTNFRVILRKDPDIEEVPDLHSGKYDAEPYKVYRFLTRRGSEPSPAQFGGESSSSGSAVRWTPDATVTLSLTSASQSTSAETSISSLCTDSSREDDVHLPPTRREAEVNIPDIVLGSRSISPFLTPDSEEMPRSHQQQQQQQQLLLLQQQDNRLQDRTTTHSTGDEFGEGTGCFSETPWIINLPEGTSHPIFIINAQEMAACSSSAEETLVPEETNFLHGAEGESDKMSVESTSLPSDLRSVKSGDLFVPELGANFLSSVHSPAKQSAEDKDMLTEPPQEHPGADIEEHGFTIKVFYGSPQRKVLERSVLSNDRGCRVLYTKGKAKVFDRDERLYGRADVAELELPDAGICPEVSARQRELMHRILGEMLRGVVFTMEHGDIYARRLCRTRAFVYDHNGLSWPLSRKTNIPEKVFDFRKFQSDFERSKRCAMSSTRSTGYKSGASAAPSPFVYLTFGHRFALEPGEGVLSKVLVAITITHRQAEHMVKTFHSRTSLGDHLCSDRLFSSMDTMDKVIDQCQSMSL